MGAGNVKAAYALWRRQVSDRPFVVLAYMALRSLDGDDTPVYFGGWEELASAALGLAVVDEADREAAKQSVKRCTKILRRAGAITTRNTPRLLNRAEYVLHLRPVRGVQPVTPSNPGQGVTQSPPMAVTESPPGGGHSVHLEGVTQSPPKEKTLGVREDLPLGINLAAATTVTDVREVVADHTFDDNGLTVPGCSLCSHRREDHLSEIDRLEFELQQARQAIAQSRAANQ